MVDYKRKIRGIPCAVNESNGRVLVVINPAKDPAITEADEKEIELVLECACFSRIKDREHPITGTLENPDAHVDIYGTYAYLLTGSQENPDAYEGTYDAYAYLLPHYKDLTVERLRSELDWRRDIVRCVCEK